MENQKKFGVWMDTHQAVVIGSESGEPESPKVLAHIKGEMASSNSSEKTSNNHEKTLQQKFYKQIASHITNATHVHVTGTGTAQEEFIHFLADTPQFKNTKTAVSTANK